MAPGDLMKNIITKNCCIFRAPRKYATEPLRVSIGPYHPPMFQSQKEIALHHFLELAIKHSGELVETADLKAALSLKDEDIRESYSETLTQTAQELVNLMMIDGCFVVMLILWTTKFRPVPHNSILAIPYLLGEIQRDLLILSNQVPFIVLETLAGKLGISVNVFKRLTAYKFFIPCFLRAPVTASVETTVDNYKPRHLLDLFRWTYIPEPITREEQLPGREISQLIVSAKTLARQGIKFKRALDRRRLLDITIDSDKVYIPYMVMSSYVTDFLLNGVAYEECCIRDENDYITIPFMSTFVFFMSSLMKDKEDASIFFNKNIIHNSKGGKMKRRYVSSLKSWVMSLLSTTATI